MLQECFSLVSKFEGHLLVLLMDPSAAFDTVGLYLTGHSSSLTTASQFPSPSYISSSVPFFAGRGGAPHGPISSHCTYSLSGILPPCHHFHGLAENSKSIPLHQTHRRISDLHSLFPPGSLHSDTLQVPQTY